MYRLCNTTPTRYQYQYALRYDTATTHGILLTLDVSAPTGILYVNTALYYTTLYHTSMSTNTGILTLVPSKWFHLGSSEKNSFDYIT